MSTFNFTMKTDISEMKLFNFLKYHAGISTRLFNKMKRQGIFYIDGKECELTSMVINNSLIKVELEESIGDMLPEFLNLDIIHEDEYLLAVNKPPDMIVHPTSSHPYGTLANGIAFHFISQGLDAPVRPVIRLDKDTSGLVIFAKNALVQQTIIDQMAEGKVKKTYIALVEGNPFPERGIINAPIARLPGSIITRHISPNGAQALTLYRTLKNFNGYSLVEVEPKTGRTHQIRVHLSYIGYPILGDTLYGAASNLISRQALHAFRYEFIHPGSKAIMCLECPIPDAIKRLI